MTQTIVLIPLILLCLSAIAYYGCVIYSTIDFSSYRAQVGSNFQPPVTILKPICGLDREMYENLASFCQQDYPEYQIVFSTTSETDPGIAVVNQIIQDFPERDLQLVINERSIGCNPKVSNLANAESQAKYGILLAADSDIRVGPSYLKRVVQPLSEASVGVVTCLYRCLPQGIAALFEALIIATEHHPAVFITQKLEGIKFAIGATIVIRRSVLNEMGGFAAIADYLEDDSQLGYRPTQLGYRVVLSDYIVNHVTGPTSWLHSMKRQARWACGTRFSDPSGYPKTILTRGTVASLLLLLVTGGSAWAWVGLITLWAVRLGMAWTVGVWGIQDPTARWFFWLAPLGDLMSFAIWCYGFVGTTIEWRSQRLKLVQDGKLEALT